ncbi:LysR family transcriptional regulator [Maricurvus nonylphenolicus]|uniref:LysR family transcriptional regulator n=1 Tax=Maricurvus nonylphenolicus TaxID=1008307 RepID=UPI0036F4424C
MELSDLRVFQQVAESGGITRAAEKLNRVPSNVTARIQKLEEELGKPLFLREKNRLRISVAGEQLLGYSHKILDLAQQAVDELQQSHPKGVLNVGSMEAVAATRLVDPLMRFHQAYADVELNVTTGPTGVLIEKVLDGEIDMAFVADPSPDPRLAIKPVYKESLVLVSDLHHKPIKKPADLDSEATLLGFNHRCAYRTRLTDWLNQDGTVAKVVEISSYHALLSCAAAGMGVGILPEALLDDYPFRDNVQVHSLPMKWRKTQTAIIWRHDSLKASMEAFVECATSG